MGAGLVSVTSLDPLLLLCLERSEINRKGKNLLNHSECWRLLLFSKCWICVMLSGCLLYSYFPLCDAGGTFGSRTLFTRSNEGVKILPVSWPFKVGGPSSKWRKSNRLQVAQWLPRGKPYTAQCDRIRSYLMYLLKTTHQNMHVLPLLRFGWTLVHKFSSLLGFVRGVWQLLAVITLLTITVISKCATSTTNRMLFDSIIIYSCDEFV